VTSTLGPATATTETYRAHLEAARSESASYTARDVRAPIPVAAGERLSCREAFGGEAPPHVELGRAIQNVLRVVRHRDVLLDPLVFTLYSLTPIEETVRVGRVKPPIEIAAQHVSTLPAAFVAGTRSYQNYYHWIVETMPRTMALHIESDGAELLTHRYSKEFHHGLASLDGLDLHLEQIHGAQFIEEAVTTTISTNFEPMPKLSRYTLPSEDILLYPRAVAPALLAGERRVFISRRDVGTRVLNDEAHLVAALEARGFDCPVASELTLRDQATLFTNAEVIVSTHGAGLSNMLYRAGRPCKVIEIVPLRRWPLNNLCCMYNLSQVSELEHYLYDCEYESEETRLLSQSWAIDHEPFLAFLDSVLD
jgi:capsular polysaccharide biosynthesis protein